MKAGKRMESYANLYTRSEDDLRVLVPFMQKRDLIRRGGIVDSVQRLLELRDEVHEAATVREVKAMPAGFWGRISGVSRGLLLGVLNAAQVSDEEVRKLLHKARVMGVEAWEGEVVRVAGSASFKPRSNAPLMNQWI